MIRLINNPDNMNFNVGMLGYIGGSMFFYLAIKFEADPILVYLPSSIRLRRKMIKNKQKRIEQLLPEE